MPKTMPDAHDLLAAERFLAAEARIAASFERTEEAVAPLLRGMRATGRTTYLTDPERGAIWGHAFLRPPYAPSVEAEWFLAWGLRFPDGGSGWDASAPRLPNRPHAIVAVGASGVSPARPLGGTPPPGWSVVGGEAAFLAAARPLQDFPAEPEAMASALAAWTLARIEEVKAALPGLAAA
ncbi:hypothetical protein [Falsiroseomonas sp.]|uniref:hypothetical protein n=1 Tax=Falsiroseomonas sp. TaxID=2870721 RepID=UPI003561A4C1